LVSEAVAAVAFGGASVPARSVEVVRIAGLGTARSLRRRAGR
jgi:hypothetical protein